MPTGLTLSYIIRFLSIIAGSFGVGLVKDLGVQGIWRNVLADL